MRSAMQSQKLNVATYNSLFGQCKSKIKPWGGWQRYATLKPSFQMGNELIEVCGLLSDARGLAHGAALEPHVAYALC